MNEAPLISVITVTAFDEARLERTLDSISGLRTNIEHLFVLPENDYLSKDLIQKYASKNLFLINMIHDKKHGIYPAMNLGAEYAKGKFLLYLNSGDEVLNQDIFISNLECIDEKTPAWAVLGVSLPWNSCYNPYTGMEKLFRRQSKRGYISHQSVIVRRDKFLEFGKFDTAYPIAADTKCIFEFANFAKPLILGGIAIKVEKGNNVTSHNRESRLEILRIINSTGTLTDKLTSNFNFFLRESLFVYRKITRKLASF